MKQEIINITVEYINNYMLLNQLPPTPVRIRKDFEISLDTAKNRLSHSMNFLAVSVQDYYWIEHEIVRK